MKKFFLFILLFVFCFSSFLFIGCCSNEIVETGSYSYSYVIIYTGSNRILHKLSNFGNRQENSCYLNLSCCHNRVIISYDKFVIFQNKPDISCYDFECSC